jgi:sugar lactone lactonase YvrE
MLRAGIALAALLLAALPPAADARAKLDIRVFAKIGPPGQPEPVAVGPDGRVYVGTNQQEHGDRRAPSRIFAFSQGGKLVRQYVLRGQPLNENHGIQGLAFDRDGLLYVLDRSADPRVVVLDPATGSQRRYASFRDVAPCASAAGGDCSRTQLDNPSGPDYGTFSASGDLYVTDIDQALIWKVPRGGGRAQVWLSDPRLESLFGPNGIQFMADGRTLLFANTTSNPMAVNPLTGRLYTVPVRPDGGAGTLTQVWESLPLDAPDGFAIARSGNVYIALAGANQVVLLSPQFAELARTPPNPAANQAEEVPLDAPASIAFLGRRLLVTNHSAIRGDASSWAVLDVFADEAGLPLLYPRIFRPALRLAARAVPGSCARLRIHVTRHLASKEVGVAGAIVRAAGVRARTNARGKATLVARLRAAGPVVVTARKGGFTAAKRTVRARAACARRGAEADRD